MACDWGMNYESIMGSGSMTIVSDPEERRRGLDLIMAHYGSVKRNSFMFAWNQSLRHCANM